MKYLDNDGCLNLISAIINESINDYVRMYKKIDWMEERRRALSRIKRSKRSKKEIKERAHLIEEIGWFERAEFFIFNQRGLESFLKHWEIPLEIGYIRRKAKEMAINQDVGKLKESLFDEMEEQDGE